MKAVFFLQSILHLESLRNKGLYRIVLGVSTHCTLFFKGKWKVSRWRYLFNRFKSQNDVCDLRTLKVSVHFLFMYSSNFLSFGTLNRQKWYP